MSACTKHAAEPVRGYSDCPGCEVESLRQQLAVAQAEVRELRERAEKAERNYQWMVERAADQHLSGYRELARRVADAENVADGLRDELARVRELAAKWRAAPQDPDEPLLAIAADELEAAISQAGESLPLMARREWMCRDTDYFVVHGDFCLEVESFRGKAPRYAADGSLIVIGDSAVCDQVDAEAQPDGIYRIADTDEHGLPVIERTADMPKRAKYRIALGCGMVIYQSELEGVGFVDTISRRERIEDYRSAAQES